MSVTTEILKLEPEFVVVQATITTSKGSLAGTGTASTQRGSRLADSLVELAESRSIARAARFSGIGVEFCGAEEVSHIAAISDQDEQSLCKKSGQAFESSYSKSESGAKAANKNENRATKAQISALLALTNKANYTREDVEKMLFPLNAHNFEDLTRQDASQLISSLQTEVAA